MYRQGDTSMSQAGKEPTSSEFRSSSRLFELALRSLRDAVFIVDSDTATITECNPAASEMFGYRREEMLGRATDFLHVAPASLEDFRQHLYAAIKETGALFLPEFRMKRKDGTVFLTEYSVRPIEDEQGRRIGWVSVVRDMTESKEDEEALKGTEGKYASIIEMAPDGILLVNRLGVIVSCNRAATEISGYPKSELVGKHFAKIGTLRARDIPKYLGLFAQILRGHTPEPFTVDAVRKDGSPHTVEVRVKVVQGMLLAMITDVTERKEAEEALRESEEKLRQILNSSPDAITMVDLDGNIVECNQATLDVHGFSSKKDLIGRSAFDLIAPEDRAQAEEAMQQTLEQGTVKNREYRLRRGDGSAFIGEISASVIYDSTGRPTGVVGITKDTSERKRMEEALREGEEKYRLLYESALVALFTTSIENGQVLEVNDQGARMFGYNSKDEFLKEFITTEHYVEPGGRKHLLNELREQGEVRNREAQFLKKDGSPFWVEFSIKISPEKGQLEIAAVDIDDRKRTEKALRNSEEKYRNMIEMAPGGIVVINKLGVIQECNTAATEISGYSKSELTGSHFAKVGVLRTGDIPKYLKLFAEILQGNIPEPFEVQCTKKDGTPFTVEAHVGLLRDGRIQAFLTDVTEREMARKQATELSRQIITLQEDLLSDISRELHDEIGQLLTAIDLEVETVRRTVKSGKNMPPDGLDRIKAVTHSAIGAVRGLCTSLRSPVISDLGLIGVMEAHINDFRERTGIAVEFDCSLKKIGVSPEAGLGLFRIMQEALTNVARHAEASRVEISLHRDNGRTVLEVADDGRGFDVGKPPSHLSGGLRGMRDRARIFGGEIVIESKPGSGTQIRVSPPPSREEEAPL